MRRILVASLLVLALAARDARAQQVERFPRPQLDSKADTNDWEAYFDYGVKLIKDRPSAAEAGFYWAQRLAPNRAEPLVAHWVAFHMRDYGRWERYVKGDDPRITNDPQIVAHDSLRWRARARNPFVSEGLVYYLYDALPGYWGDDAATRGFLYYSGAKFPQAVDAYRIDVKHGARKHPWKRWSLAQALVGARRFPEALAQVDSLCAALDSASARTTSSYESKEVLDLGAAMLHQVLGDTAEARLAAERGLTENFAFYPAHTFLGELARSSRDMEGALREFELAAQLAPNDAAVMYDYGSALAFRGQIEPALAAMRKATALEPYYALPWLGIARVLDATHDAEGARAAYQAYLDRAPRSSAREIAAARDRIAALAR
ncbi:MAG: hypothetical protein HOQ11_13015 [Gemmatimonadaceae bacterium]|nr:hypothetical protein [Gemmatimonadaceae bacterium]NUQ92941.1 hypothetical protein [Gemmatimonadaceae bacterium]NUR20330.1 hypothetical protein [Gemmatimonadaceae bacterium]NUS98319.1 hypothetical protein [Gemmatimonadaceae bacterium]